MIFTWYFYERSPLITNSYHCWQPKCELPKLIIRHNIGPISAANSWLLLLGQCHRLHRSSAGPTMAAIVDCLNLPTFSWNVAQYQPYIKPIVTYTMASSSESRRARVRPMDSTLLGHVSLLPRQTILKVRKPEFGSALARCYSENKCWRPFWARIGRQVHTGVVFPATARYWQHLCRCWASVGPYITSHLRSLVLETSFVKIWTKFIN